MKPFSGEGILTEIHAYGTDSYGDPDYASIYGLRPAVWYAKGIRLLGRTAVECTENSYMVTTARKKKSAKLKTSAYDVAEHLRSPEEMVAYLDAWLDAGPGRR